VFSGLQHVLHPFLPLSMKMITCPFADLLIFSIYPLSRSRHGPCR
jgi:hypothetical protein